jgi:hypothetical protein
VGKARTPEEIRKLFTIRKSNDPTFLKIADKAWRKEIKVDPKVVAKTRAHQFYRLPEEQWADAQKYFNRLCLKHEARLKVTPNFRNILHMITLNHFKNPGQTAQAGKQGHHRNRQRWAQKAQFTRQARKAERDRAKAEAPKSRVGYQGHF